MDQLFASLTIEPLDSLFCVCLVEDYSGIVIDQPFVFTGRTDHERSLVCPQYLVPSNAFEKEEGWRGFRIKGQLDFSLVGIQQGFHSCWQIMEYRFLPYRHLIQIIFLFIVKTLMKL